MTAPRNIRKVLIIVDVQSAFITKRNEYVVGNIVALLKKVPYDLYVESIFHAEHGSLWDVQTGWVCPKDKNFHTDTRILDALKGKRAVHIEKETKSVFKGSKNLKKLLRERGIKEVHIVGYDSNDCVLATAFEAFDLGFFTYVIEGCVESSSTKALHKNAIAILQHLSLTRSSSK
ncbi:MAG: isochorismatase family cysteine hydrolase [bacterium]|nr:isochorismatase family cysteine hydrolase [bacterium]